MLNPEFVSDATTPLSLLEHMIINITIDDFITRVLVINVNYIAKLLSWIHVHVLRQYMYYWLYIMKQIVTYNRLTYVTYDCLTYKPSYYGRSTKTKR